MTVRRMTADDLALVLDWAAAEGWNPGLDDAAAFFAADPGGFFIKEVAGRPVAAIAVVNHDPNHAFLGLYICQPGWRGQGHGTEVWRAGLRHAGARCIGLDGVPDQQANYARSGFVLHGRTRRFGGQIVRGVAPLAVPATDRTALIGADRQATGFDRARFARAWFSDSTARRTLCLPEGPAGQNFATFRKCRDGVKIGPLHACNADAVLALLASAPAEFGDGMLYIDVPDNAPRLAALLTGQGFTPVFETARMYSGPPPVAAPPSFHAVASLELG